MDANLEHTMKDQKDKNLSPSVIPQEKCIKNKKFWQIHIEILKQNLNYFLLFSALGATLPFQSLYAIKNLGMTAENLAAIYTAKQFLMVFFKPGIGYLTDYFNKLKAIVIVLIILQATVYLIMFIIPKFDIDNNLDHYEPFINSSLNKLVGCDLCDIYEDLRNERSELLQKEIPEGQSKNCLRQIYHNRTHYNIICSEKDALSNMSSNETMKITLIMCDNLSKISANSTTAFLKNIDPDNLSILSKNYSEIIYIICISQNDLELELNDFNSTFSFLKKNCYFVSKDYILDQDFSITKHDTPSRNISCYNRILNKQTDLQEITLVLQSAAVFNTYQFWLFAVLVIIAGSCTSSIICLSDTACYETIQNYGGDYGRMRSFSAIGWGLFALLAGFLNDFADSFLPSWLLMAVFSFIQISILWKMKFVKPNFSQNSLIDLKNMLISFEFIAFEIGVLMNGILISPVWLYFAWFLNDIGGTKLILGLSQTIECFLGEIPFFVISTWMIEKLGHFNVLSLALLAHGVRYFIFSFLHNPWWTLPAGILHGITYGAFFAALTSYAKLSSKPGTESTVQSTLQVIHEALGIGLGSIIFGICFDKFGSHITFRYTSFICVLAMVVNIIFTVIIKFRNKKAIIVISPTL